MFVTMFLFVSNYSKPSCSIYKQLVNDVNDQPWDQYDKWARDISMEQFDTEIDWYKHVINWYQCTKSVELHSFIYNYNMRNIVTKKYLYQIGKEENDLCPKCLAHTEDIAHMFWNCRYVRALWTEMNVWLSAKLNINIVNLQESI